MAQTHSSAAFMAKLLQPIDTSQDADTIAAHGLTKEADAIAEALEMVAKITAARDACTWGSRARAVQNIMLHWWTKELSDLVGYDMEGC